MSTAAGHGHFQDWLVEPYERSGSIRGVTRRAVLALGIYTVAWAGLSGVIISAAGRLSFDQSLRLHLVNFLDLTTTFVLVTSLVVWRDIRALELWEAAGRPATDVPELARKASGAPSLWASLSIAIYLLLGIPTWIAYVLFAVEPLRLAGALIACGIAASTLVVWPVFYFVAELALRPVFTRLTAATSAEVLRGARSHSLRARALLPVPLVTLSTGIFVAGLVTRIDDPAHQLWAALALSLAFALMYAALLHYIVIAAALRPVDDVTEGVHRVAGGDLAHRVPITSSDEFADLARDFNEMTGRLEAHDEEIQASRARIVAAADESRRRVERDLHDGAQQYLVLMQLKLGLLARAVAPDPNVSGIATELKADLENALSELRDLAHGLYPAVLESDGLPAALQAAGERSALSVFVEPDGVGRLAPEVESAVYFCCLEAMQNAAKHGGKDATVTVSLDQADGQLRFTVADDGRGYDSSMTGPSGGLQNMADRIGALGGELAIESQPGRGTRVSGTVPLEVR